MHIIRITRTGDSLDQEFVMKTPLITDSGNCYLIMDEDNKAHKVFVFHLNLLTIEIIPQ